MNDYRDHLFQPGEPLNEGIIDWIKNKRKSKFQRFTDNVFIKDPKRIATRAAGMVGAHLLNSKLRGKSLRHDIEHGSFKDNLGRHLTTAGGAAFGDYLYSKATGKK